MRRLKLTRKNKEFYGKILSYASIHRNKIYSIIRKECSITEDELKVWKRKDEAINLENIIKISAILYSYEEKIHKLSSTGCSGIMGVLVTRERGSLVWQLYDNSWRYWRTMGEVDDFWSLAWIKKLPRGYKSKYHVHDYEKAKKKTRLNLAVAEQLSITSLIKRLSDFNYQRVEYVYKPGQFAVRGGIMDVYSFDSKNPFRLDFYGDEIDSIRSFDPKMQTTINKLKNITISTK